MPTYEFACPNGHEFEKFYKMSEAPAEAPCPQCGAAAARRISGGAGLVFKGSGFYLTDYGKNAHRKGGDAPKKGDGAESKPAAEAKGADSGGAKPSEGAKPAASAPAASKPAPKKSE